jgi:GNAT superfamily N-acetyltransferase
MELQIRKCRGNILMKNISLINGYSIKSVCIDSYNSVEKLCKNCSDYYILHNGIAASKKDIDEIFIDLPPNKNYEDKFVLGIYNIDNKLVGIVDIVRDFPNVGEWIIGLMLIKPNERSNGIGKILHKSLVEWAINSGAKSFRIGVVEDNHKGINFWCALGYKKIKEVNMNFTAKAHVVNVMTLKFYD